MIPFKLTILGSNAAMPAHGRFTSQQVLNIDESLIMIDCGEGAQMRLQQYKIKRNKIELILISHLHGDHFFGLPGLLTSFNHQDRKEPLTLIGPTGLRNFVNTTLEISQCVLKYPLDIKEIELEECQLIFETSKAKVFAFPLKHRILTHGYKIMELDAPINVNKEAIKKHQLSIQQIIALKNGHDILLSNNQKLSNNEATLPRRKSRSYAYCSDTVFDLSIVAYIENVDLLYHETTYLEDMKTESEARMHSTSVQAAKIAKAAQVKKLITGHYSGRYRNVDAFKTEAQKIFPNVLLGYDGLMISIDYSGPSD